MKLDARAVEGLLRDPSSVRVVLFHGEDDGLIHERGSALVRAAAGSLDDPFRVAELDREQWAGLAGEAASLPMTGGRRVVRVRDVTDALAEPVQAVLRGKAEGLVVLEAGSLQARSKLRTVVEAAKDAASVGCYAETGSDLARTIATMVAAAGLTVEPEAREYLVAHLGSDRGTTRRELEKLALHVHPRGVVTLDDAMEAVGDMAGLQLEDALYAALAGDMALADRSLDLALAEGGSAVGVLRACLMQLQRLQQVRLAINTGASAMEAVKTLRPPVFYRRQAPLAQAAGRWSDRQLAAACDAVWRAERACKQTGSPAVTLCRHVLLQIARQSRATRQPGTQAAV